MNHDTIRPFHFFSNRVSKSNALSSCATFATFTDDDSQQQQQQRQDLRFMSIREIKDELKEMGISFSDCFDKDSLIERLEDARNGNLSSAFKVASPSKDDNSNPSRSSNSTTTTTARNSTGSAFNREATAADLRTKTVRQLRTLCAESNIRWANLIEKEELVQALVQYQEECLKFSRSGKIMPGKVALIDDDTLTKELTTRAASSLDSTAPLLLDVFATWCGPCKMMSPFLEDAAAQLGDKVRVAKIDSDQYPEWASQLNVRSLPTIIVFDGKTGKELERVEGALSKDQLVQLAMKHVA
jgi:Thioredoxin domain-containing protein